MGRLGKLFLLLIGASLFAGAQAQQARQPNFIVIMADDLGMETWVSMARS